MTFRVTSHLQSLDESTQRGITLHDITGGLVGWVREGDLVTIEFDTETKTATVVPL